MKEFVAPGPDEQSFETVLNLALIYLRHGQPDRALALGIAAMAFGPVSPRLALLVADAFLQTGQPDQAEAILSRFSGSSDLLEPQPDMLQRAAANVLLAKTSQKSGDKKGARDALAKAASYARELS